MRRVLRFLGLTPVVILLMLLTPARSPQSAVVRAQARNFKLWGIYWSAEPGFHSTLEMKNNRVREQPEEEIPTISSPHFLFSVFRFRYGGKFIRRIRFVYRRSFRSSFIRGST